MHTRPLELVEVKRFVTAALCPHVPTPTTTFCGLSCASTATAQSHVRPTKSVEAVTLVAPRKSANRSHLPKKQPTANLVRLTLTVALESATDSRMVSVAYKLVHKTVVVLVALSAMFWGESASQLQCVAQKSPVVPSPVLLIPTADLVKPVTVVPVSQACHLARQSFASPAPATKIVEKANATDPKATVDVPNLVGPATSVPTALSARASMQGSPINVCPKMEPVGFPVSKTNTAAQALNAKTSSVAAKVAEFTVIAVTPCSARPASNVSSPPAERTVCNPVVSNLDTVEPPVLLETNASVVPVVTRVQALTSVWEPVAPQLNVPRWAEVHAVRSATVCANDKVTAPAAMYVICSPTRGVLRWDLVFHKKADKTVNQALNAAGLTTLNTVFPQVLGAALSVKTVTHSIAVKTAWSA